MYPEDRVLVGIMPNLGDLLIAQEEGWYRIRAAALEEGIHAEYIAFYFPGSRFPKDQRLGIYYYARQMGHELVRRVDLFPDEPNHKRADHRYYKVRLGPLQVRTPPIRNEGDWRRITFIHTTWDRFVAAEKLADLFSTDDQFVDRVYHALRRRGVKLQRDAIVEDSGKRFQVDILIPCQDGAVMFTRDENRPPTAHLLTGYESLDMERINKEITKRGGPLLLDLPL